MENSLIQSVNVQRVWETLYLRLSSLTLEFLFYILGAGKIPPHNPKQRQPALWCRLPACQLQAGDFYVRLSSLTYLRANRSGWKA